MRKHTRIERLQRYRSILNRRKRPANAMPGYLTALGMLALLLGLAVPLRMSASEMKAELAGAFGVTPTPGPTATPTLPPVQHISLPIATPTPTPEPQAPDSTPKSEPKIEILIYHTHATEAYRQTDGYTYEPSGNCRTKEESKNVVAIGALLKELLEDRYGYGVLHDTSNHEPPKLATAYSRSLEAMQAHQKQNPTLRYFIDVHRDAYGKSESGEKDYVTIKGKDCARLMFVVGTGKGATGTGFREMPDFDANYAFAEGLTNGLKEIDTQFMRDIRVKTGRYNQHVSDRCLLIEVGHNANTFEQAINSVPLLAKALDEAIKKDAQNASH